MPAHDYIGRKIWMFGASLRLALRAGEYESAMPRRGTKRPRAFLRGRPEDACRLTAGLIALPSRALLRLDECYAPNAGGGLVHLIRARRLCVRITKRMLQPSLRSWPKISEWAFLNRSRGHARDRRRRLQRGRFLTKPRRGSKVCSEDHLRPRTQNQ